MKKKNQAAVEFIMNYGIVILGVLILILTLIYFEILNVDMFLPDYGSAGEGFTIEEFLINEWNIFLIVTNEMENTARDFTITAYSCNNGKGSQSTSIEIPYGKTQTIFIRCNGTALMYEKFGTDLTINYEKYVQGNLMPHINHGRLRGTVNKGCICKNNEVCIYGMCFSDVQAYWPLDNDMKDLSGNAHHGIGYNNPQLGDGKFRGAYWFNGINTYIDTTAVIDTSADYTISGWARLKEKDEFQNFFGSNQGKRFYTGITNTGDYALGYGMNYSDDIPAIQIEPNEWFHFVFMGDGDTARLFINQEKAASFVFEKVGIQSYSNYIGARRGPPDIGYAPDYFLNGSVDEVILFSRAISPGEIEALFSSVSIIP